VTSLPENSRFDFAPGLNICRIVTGMWQVSGAHGRIDPRAAVREMGDYLDAGFTTWDLADHYGPAEDFIGQFRRALAAREPSDVAGMQAFTKWVPPPTRVTRRMAEEAVATSRRRMASDMLDLLQFHWWDYGNPAYLDALGYLAELRDAGQIRHLALTNFDTEHLNTIVARGIRIVSNQVQFSLIDRRPERSMIPYCLAHGITLLPYGALCGGLLTESYLGRPEPRASALQTASLRKYKQMIDAWGGWGLFQELLATLKQIAERHGARIGSVAVRAILDKPAVAGVIVGARLGVAEHRADSARVFGLVLDDADLAAIDAVCARARDLYALIGDCGDEYRR
jgi:aryl-alcohol dehydrogenase-like predicted oxidoreductase